MVAPQPKLLSQLLEEQLYMAREQTGATRSRNARGTLIHIPKTGKRLASAYEHLRNAAEYAEEHLLLQRAIRRFYMRDVFFARRRLDNIGEELIIELTQAGYLRNGSVGSELSNAIREQAQDALRTYGELRKTGVERDQAVRWVLDILSVETEEMLNPHGHLTVIADVAYRYYLRSLPRNKLAMTVAEDNHYEVSLYMATHQALLKSDLAIIRHDLIKLYAQDPHQTRTFTTLNQDLDQLYTRPFTQRLRRTVSRHGAPFRVLKELASDRADLTELLRDRQSFMTVYDQQIAQEYRHAKRLLNQGIVKSVIFLLITKVVIGVAVEVPYDLLVIGSVAFMPLTINLLVPPLYIASLKFFLRAPTRANAVTLRNAIDKILYTSEQPPPSSLRLGRRRLSTPARILFSILFFIPILIIVTLLRILDFTIVQGVIFFIFLSTASFLGFRLSRIIRDLEIDTKPSGFLVSIGDFFYLPFIQIGQWFSGKYARLNAPTIFLDMAIELPLKTTLRLVRQWTRFLDEERDEMY